MICGNIHRAIAIRLFANIPVQGESVRALFQNGHQKFCISHLRPYLSFSLRQSFQAYKDNILFLFLHIWIKICIFVISVVNSALHTIYRHQLYHIMFGIKLKLVSSRMSLWIPQAQIWNASHFKVTLLNNWACFLYYGSWWTYFELLEALRERRPPWPRQIITLILSTVKMLSLGCERLPTPLK